MNEIELKNTDPFGGKARVGYRILTVWFVRAKEGDADYQYYERFKGAAAEVYVADGGNSRLDVLGTGFWLGRLFLVFEVPTSMHGLELFWPGNPSIALRK